MIERFSQLQTLRTLDEPKSSFAQIVRVLTKSSLQMLDVGLHSSALAKDGISVLTTFPNLKQIQFAQVRMYMQYMNASSSQKPDVLRVKGLSPKNYIVQERDHSQSYRPIATIVCCWKLWFEDRKLVHEV